MTTGNLSIQDNDTVVQYTAVGESAFVFNFPILETDELKVSRNQVLLTYGVDYSITGLGADGGGSIGLLGGPSTPGDVWTLWQDMPIERLTGFSAGAAAILGTALNSEFSARLRVEQQLRREIRNSLRIPPDDPVSSQNMVLPSKVLRAGKYQAYDANGLPIASSGTGNDSALRSDLAISTAGGDGARLSGYRRNATGSTARSVGSKLDERISILDFGGNGNGIANNDAAFTSANTEAVASGLYSIDLPAGDYLVTAFPTLTAGVRLTGEGRMVTTTSHRRTWEYGGPATTTSARTYFVDVALGNDKNDGLAVGAGRAWKTLQRAWNQLPPVVLHKITINIADGTYESNELAAGAMERASILYCTGKFIRGRTDQASSGADTTGYVLFKGTTKAGTIIRTIGSYIYGVYCSQVGNVGFDEMTLRSNVAGTISLLVSHRTGMYVQGSNIAIDGNAGQAGYAAYAEAGGVLELTGNGAISGSVNGVQCYDGSVIEIANDITVAGTSTAISIGGGAINIDGKVAINSPVVVQSGKLYARGQDTGNRVTFTAALTLINAVFDATFVNISGALDATNSEIVCNASAYSNAWILQNSDLRLLSTPSFISPAVASTVLTPLSLLLNSRFYRDSAANSPINGSAGRTNAVRNVVSQTIAANGATIATFLAAGDNCHHTINAAANRTNCVMAAVDGNYGGAPMEDTLLTLSNPTAFSVQIINSTTADIVGTSILLGTAAASGNYKSISLRWTNGLWREVSRSLVVP